jgi:hypothetical protein
VMPREAVAKLEAGAEGATDSQSTQEKTTSAVSV